MSISPRFLEELRSRLTLSDVIGKRIKVTRAGREYKACCPFHKEKTPSFTINDDKQFYHCFGCGAHGDVVNFVMEHDNLPFRETVEQLAAQAGLQVPRQTVEAVHKAKTQKDLYALMDTAARWFQAQLKTPENRDVWDYVAARGFKEDVLNVFSLGYAPSDPQALRQHLKAEGFSDSQMQEVALTKISAKGGDPYVFFRDRVMFPVMDRRGRVVAFGGRVLPDYMRPPSQSSYVPAKYMNSPETSIFNKGMMLYGEHVARKAAGDGQPLIVVEGYFDVMACYQAGYHGAVAPMGTALTEEQIPLLWKMIPDTIKEPYLCFDGDNAGRRAALRAMERILPLLEAGQTAKIVFLPDGEDPDSLLQGSSKEVFQNILEASMSLIDFLWQSNVAGKKLEGPEARAALVKTLNDSVKTIQDREVQRHYYELIKQMVSAAFFKRYKKQARQQGRAPGALSKPGGLRRPSLEMQNVPARALLAAILNYPQIYHAIEEEFAQFHMADMSLQRLRDQVIGVLSDTDELDSLDLQRKIEHYGHGKILATVLAPSTYLFASFCAPSEEEVDSADIVRQWKKIYEKMEEQNLLKEIHNGWKTVSSKEDEDRLKRLTAGQLLKKSSEI